MNIEGDRPFVQRELLEFGPETPEYTSSSSAEAGNHAMSEASVTVELGGFDEEPTRPSDRRWSASSIIAAGRRLDASRAFTVVAAMVTLTALNFAVVGWA